PAAHRAAERQARHHRPVADLRAWRNRLRQPADLGYEIYREDEPVARPQNHHPHGAEGLPGPGSALGEPLVARRPGHFRSRVYGVASAQTLRPKAEAT